MDDRSRPVHFVGIGGVGMSAMARILLQRGERVSGSDLRRTALTQELEAAGARITFGHAAANIGNARAVVVSSAVAPQNPELVAARAGGIPVLRRGTMLAHLIEDRRCIAIAGTHGKTTTTAMVASVLRAGGVDPSVVLGGEFMDSASSGHHGSGSWFVTESDESDGSFLELDPYVAVVGNIENDHVADDAALARLIESFERFVAGIGSSGLVLLGADDARTAKLARRASARVATFGMRGDATWRAAGLTFEGLGSQCVVSHSGDPVGTLRLRVPGAINVLNALPSLAIAAEAGVPFEVALRALAEFAGVRRRFEILSASQRMTLIDDYAHHPTAVRATIEAARRSFGGHIVVAFQPHRYSRTSYLAREFAQALSAADEVVLTGIYAASEAPIDGVDERSIGDPLGASGTPVTYVRDVADLPEYLLDRVAPGSLVLMLGAGSITAAAAKLAGMLAERPAEVV